jgi:CMP-N,N'-diacetyllegionaminic acid synthase
MKNTVAIIPARGGSKGIPHKNLKNFCGKPLIVWTINQALKVKNINSVWVSSDSTDILEISKKAGANVIIRPKSLSVDTATSESAWLHALDYIEKKMKSVDIIVGLQATNPIRESLDIENAINKFKRTKSDSLFSSSEIGNYFIWKKIDKKLTSLNYDYKKRARRQNFSEQFVENGSIYVFKPEILRKFNNRLGGKIEISLMENWKSFDIDTLDDFSLCETLMKRYLLKK